MLLTLCIIQKDSRVLLGMKKRGFGKGWWNGFGGKVQDGESIESATVRETIEEVGIKPLHLKKAGILIFHFENNPHPQTAHVFISSTFEGEPTETDEMKPQWFDIKEIPYKLMWPADIYWLPPALDGKIVHGEFHFSKTNKLIAHVVK